MKKRNSEHRSAGTLAGTLLLQRNKLTQSLVRIDRQLGQSAVQLILVETRNCLAVRKTETHGAFDLAHEHPNYRVHIHSIPDSREPDSIPFTFCSRIALMRTTLRSPSSVWTTSPRDDASRTDSAVRNFKVHLVVELCQSVCNQDVRDSASLMSAHETK